MTEEDFTILGAHVEELVPLINQFCMKHNFLRVTGPSVGRYPRVRLQKCDDIVIWMDLWMSLDKDGKRFTTFQPDVPYELSAGAFFDERSERAVTWRYQKSFQVWPSMPFQDVRERLLDALESTVATLQKWDRSFLREEGVRVQVG